MIFPPPNFTPAAGGPVHRGVASVVFGVVDDRSGAELVCKRLSSRAGREVEAARALVREGEILEALAGRGAPRLRARGEDAAGPYVVTERLAMEPLDRCRDVEAAARSALEALALVHEAGFVHGDVSPSNVLATVDGSAAALADFGLAFPVGEAPSGGAFRGTLAFAAPEAARGEPLDARSDLFALAASVLSVASRSLPRAAAHDAALLVAAGEQPVDRWAERAAALLSPELGRALLRCVAFEREGRPVSARDALGRAARTC